MKIEEIDNCDDLDDIKVFAILVTDVPSKYVAQAKKIDGKYYKEDCLGIEISYHADEDKYVISSEYDKQLYYVDFNGNWHWLDYTFTQAEKDAAIELCKKDLQKEAEPKRLCLLFLFDYIIFFSNNSVTSLTLRPCECMALSKFWISSFVGFCTLFFVLGVWSFIYF